MYTYIHTVGQDSLVATAWTVRGSNPNGGEIFCTRPDEPCFLPSLIYMYVYLKILSVFDALIQSLSLAN